MNLENGIRTFFQKGKMANFEVKYRHPIQSNWLKILLIFLLAVLIFLVLYYVVEPYRFNNFTDDGALKKLNTSEASNFTFQSGDLLFQDLDCGDLCDAIEKVAVGKNGKSFSHIGLVCYKNDSAFVIEAIGNDVHLTWLNHFINRSKNKKGNPKIAVGRLKNKFNKINPKAVKFALAQIGTPYDNQFLYHNQRYYCSELIYDAYKFANDQEAFFDLKPMTFNDPATGKPMLAWQQYYQQLKIPIPEGQLGCNPSGISLSTKIDIVKIFY